MNVLGCLAATAAIASMLLITDAYSTHHAQDSSVNKGTRGHFPDVASGYNVGKCKPCHKCKPVKGHYGNTLKVPKDKMAFFELSDVKGEFHLNYQVKNGSIQAHAFNTGFKRWTDAFYDIVLSDKASTSFKFELNNNNVCQLNISGPGIKSATAYVTRTW